MSSLQCTSSATMWNKPHTSHVFCQAKHRQHTLPKLPKYCCIVVFQSSRLASHLIYLISLIRIILPEKEPKSITLPLAITTAPSLLPIPPCLYEPWLENTKTKNWECPKEMRIHQKQQSLLHLLVWRDCNTLPNQIPHFSTKRNYSNLNFHRNTSEILTKKFKTKRVYFAFISL